LRRACRCIRRSVAASDAAGAGSSGSVTVRPMRSA
jgi:hypothetical protein